MDFLLLLLTKLDSEEDKKLVQEILYGYYTVAYSNIKRNTKTELEADEVMSYVSESIINNVHKLKVMKNDEIRFFIYRASKSALRRYKRFKDKEALPLEVEVEDDSDIIEKIILSEDEERIFEMLRKLPDEIREMLTYKYVDNMSYSEIAKKLGISKSSVYRLRDRIIKRFSEDSAKKEIENAVN